VRLGRGEAFFTVAKNPARPFIVTVAGVDVRAVGTEFNVRLHLDAVEVVVREGRVRVDDASNGGSLLAPSAEPAATDAARDILDAGHRVTIPVSAAPKPVVAVTPEPMAVPEIERTLAWREERLVFEAAPLSAIVAEFNRYSRRPMVLADAELAQRRFGGTFDARDSRTFLDLLRTTEGIVAEERSGDILLKPGR
jgi:transmembrane sensor